MDREGPFSARTEHNPRQADACSMRQGRRVPESMTHLLQFGTLHEVLATVAELEYAQEHLHKPYGCSMEPQRSNCGLVFRDFCS